ncbi:MAG: PLP-dependent aminotransferase family protein [Oscillospiraceae bacterium]|nr:PLP-dependent aminotransferase family protein [Oscillospiraceae bacterium]
MYLKVDKSSGIPAYRQIYAALRTRILSGAFLYGARLPSKRELSRDCLVSIATVEHAYQMLCEEGFCEMRPRSGCYVRYLPERDFPVSDVALPAPGTPEESLPHSDIPFSPVAAMLRRVLLDYGDRILMRSPPHGCHELRDAICRYLSRCRSIRVRPEQIVIGSGAEYLYGVCIQMLGREHTVALEDPSYEKIGRVYAANGAACELLPMDAEGIRPDALAQSTAHILHVTPFHSFPSGITASAQRRAAYLQWAGQRGAVIIEDDYDSEFLLTGTAPETLFAQSGDGNVIYLNTFSKTIAPSLRAGYMLLPERLLPLYERTVGFYSCTVPMLEQFFLTEWLDSGEFERRISRLRHRTDTT